MDDASDQGSLMSTPSRALIAAAIVIVTLLASYFG
jgi:hypothetical protein